MSEDEIAGQVTPAGAKAPGKSKLVPLLLVMNTALMGAMLFFVMKRPAVAPDGDKKSAAGEHAGKEADEKEEGEHGGARGKPGPIVKLEPFVIQLRSVEAERYVRISFDLEIASAADEQAVKDRLSHIRDTVISYFSDRTLDELRGSDGMERVKQALLKRFDEVVPGRRIRSLFVTDFVMQ